MDGLDAYRCSVFRNEGAGLASTLIGEAVALTVALWGDPPRDEWVTWVDTRKVASENPGYCFKQAGWWLDRQWSHRYLIRLRYPPSPHPPRNRGEGTGVDGLMPVGQEDTPKE